MPKSLSSVRRGRNPAVCAIAIRAVLVIQPSRTEGCITLSCGCTLNRWLVRVTDSIFVSSVPNSSHPHAPASYLAPSLCSHFLKAVISQGVTGTVLNIENRDDEKIFSFWGNRLRVQSSAPCWPMPTFLALVPTRAVASVQGCWHKAVPPLHLLNSAGARAFLGGGGGTVGMLAWGGGQRRDAAHRQHPSFCPQAVWPPWLCLCCFTGAEPRKCMEDLEPPLGQGREHALAPGRLPSAAKVHRIWCNGAGPPASQFQHSF